MTLAHKKLLTKKNMNMKKEQLIPIIFIALFAAVIGFYSGRYYERKALEKFRTERINSMNMERSDRPEGFVPGTGPRDGSMGGAGGGTGIMHQ